MKKNFYQLSATEAILELKTDATKGLSQQEAKRRLEEHGANQLHTTQKRITLWSFFDQFKDPLIVVLIIAALLAYYLGDIHGGTVLLAIVFINACIGFYQEYKAESILESLKKMVRSHALVIRGGQRIEIDSSELVPGDIVYLEEGSAVPADVRLLETIHFSTNDFILTGESVPQEKRADLVLKKEVTVTDQDNCVFLGTTVAKGNALAVVFGTGMNTVIGRIAKTSAEITETASPLQQELSSLAKTLTKIAGFIALGIFVINLVLNMGDGDSLKKTIQLSMLFALGVGAACVPQGLPTQISVALSLGVSRMARKKAIVKKLSAVETLGSTNIICSDKTGTITKNEMTILHCYLMHRSFRVTGTGYDPTGTLLDERGKKVSRADLMTVKQFLADGFLASNGRVNPPDAEHAGWYALGDPTEAAFCTLVLKSGLDPRELDRRFPRLAELPFDSDRKRMTIVREHKGKIIAYMKGGVESVLDICTHSNKAGVMTPLAAADKKMILAAAEGYSAQALRVIALAYRDLPKTLKDHSMPTVEKGAVFAGFVTMMDPPRTGVLKAIQAAYGAHIKVMMITGDNAITAKAIAEKIGMNDRKNELMVLTGEEVAAMKDAKLCALASHRSVIFARVSPEDKYRLVKLFTGMSHVVAVTGDGVNDTLSLKKADIGVAMGKMGSEVAKEAAEMVLLDDNFSTLVTAIREGRTIFQNLKKTILASIAANTAELVCVLLGFIGVPFGLPIPITAVQILAVDLAGEILPLTALTFDPPEKSLMQSRPRDLKEHVINRKSLLYVFFYGFFIGAVAYFSFTMVRLLEGGSLARSQAIAYGTINLCQFMNILCMRTERTLFTSYLWKNRPLLISFIISAGIIALLLYVPTVSLWFGFEGPQLRDWIYPLIGFCFILALHELRKAFFKPIPLYLTRRREREQTGL